MVATVGGNLVFVHTDDGLLARVDARLGTRGGFLDTQFRNAVVDGLGHAPVLSDLLDM